MRCQQRSATVTLPLLGAALLAASALAAPPPRLQPRVRTSEAFPVSTPERQGLSSDALEQLGARVRGYVADGLVMGAEVAVISRRHLVYHEVFGQRDDGVPWTKNTICNVRSMTKPLTGAAAQLLIEDGKLGLDEPVATYLPAFDTEASRTITIRHLMTHRSGLPLTMLTTLFDEYDSLRALADAAGARPPDFEPGSEFQYSDTGSDVLGAVIEVVSGRPLDVFIEQRFLEPLGMRDSFYFTDPADPRAGRVASLYLGSANNWQRFWTPDDGTPLYPYAVGSQSLYSTPLDYARFLAMWMDRGRFGEREVMPAAAVERMLTPASVTPLPTGFPDLIVEYGQMSVLYVPRDAGPDARPEAIGHSGSDGTWAVAWPGRDLMVLYFTQSRGQGSGVRLEEAIDDLLLHPGRVRTAEAVPPRYEPYVGVYVANFALHENEPFEVKVHDGGLALDVPSQMLFDLHDADAEGRWVFKLTDEVNVTFERDADGLVHLMKIHQAGMTFDVPREGTPLAAKMAVAHLVDPARVQPCLGRFLDPETDRELVVYLEERVLSIRTPEGIVVQLMPTEEALRFTVRQAPMITISFQLVSGTAPLRESGRAISMTREMGDTTLVMPRIEEREDPEQAPAAAPEPGADEPADP